MVSNRNVTIKLIQIWTYNYYLVSQCHMWKLITVVHSLYLISDVRITHIIIEFIYIKDNKVLLTIENRLSNKQKTYGFNKYHSEVTETINEPNRLQFYTLLHVMCDAGEVKKTLYTYQIALFTGLWFIQSYYSTIKNCIL